MHDVVNASGLAPFAHAHVMAAPDKIGRGIIRRVSLPNSWAGDYGRCAQALLTAQEFFRQSFGEPTIEDGFDAFSPVRRLGLASSRSIFWSSQAQWHVFKNLICHLINDKHR